MDQEAEPGEIAAADEVFALAPAAGVPLGLDEDSQEDFRHIKATIAVAAVD